MEGNTRNETRGKDANAEIDALLRQGVDPKTALSKVAGKHINFSAIAEADAAFAEKWRKMKKRVEKFKQYLRNKYISDAYGRVSEYDQMPVNKLMQKARKFALKKGYTDAEATAFVNMVVRDRTDIKPFVDYETPNTQMGRLFNFSLEQRIAAGLNASPQELEVVQSIINLYHENMNLCQEVTRQSLMYKDCAPEAITGTYEFKKDDTALAIHPVIAALFIPRVRYLDEHMLIASIARIVYHKQNNLHLNNQPDMELYWDLVTDPQDVACINTQDSPLSDLLVRAQVQVALWKVVKELRQGRYYTPASNEFMRVLGSCRTNVFDQAEFGYVFDEGTILRRLLGAFSLRPTLVSIAPVVNAVYGYTQVAPMNRITTVPILNLRLPYAMNRSNISVSLNDAFQQREFFIENKNLVPRNKSVVYSRDVIFVYVNRRFQTINYAKIIAPYQFQALPVTASGFERINDINVSFRTTIPIAGENFNLKTVVCVDRSKTNPDIIVGCSTCITCVDNQTQEPYHLLYDPLGAQFKQVDTSSSGRYKSQEPITFLAPSGTDISFQTRAAKRGTIFMYVKEGAQDSARNVF